MAIYLSEKLKQYRKARDLTQEQIADIFYVSPQAVSRWETGVSSPDIEMLPAIADFFKVTVDDLLGVDIAKKEERVLEIFEQTGNLVNREEKDGSEIDEAIEIVKNGLREFPNNVYLLARLSGVFRRKMAECKEAGKTDEMKKYAEKSVMTAERLVNEHSDYAIMPVIEQKYGIKSEMRYGAIGNIAYLYDEINETEQAVAWANKLPDIEYAKMFVLSRVLKGEEKIKQIKWNISLYSHELNTELKMLSECAYNNADVPEEIKRFKAVIAELEKYAKKEE